MVWKAHLNGLGKLWHIVRERQEEGYARGGRRQRRGQETAN